MQKIFDYGYVEIVLLILMDFECWYLLLFGVYYFKKFDFICMVFDFLVRYEGLVLNDVLFKGLDLINNFLGVFLWFCKDEIVIIGDIEQMFYNFKVIEKDRDFLRFFWYFDGDFDILFKEYRMIVYVFGNIFFFLIVMYGLYKVV